MGIEKVVISTQVVDSRVWRDGNVCKRAGSANQVAVSNSAITWVIVVVERVERGFQPIQKVNVRLSFVEEEIAKLQKENVQIIIAKCHSRSESEQR